MPEYTCKGVVELTNVDFYITADTPEEAAQKAERGDWDFYEVEQAECLDATPNVRTIRVNE